LLLQGDARQRRRPPKVAERWPCPQHLLLVGAGGPAGCPAAVRLRLWHQRLLLLRLPAAGPAAGGAPGAGRGAAQRLPQAAAGAVQRCRRGAALLLQ
jgi:hypothetical protein